MNAERLLQHYEQIADFPHAIARLRRFVLDLAVRGKLVPQDSRDEPASELLAQIEVEKARLVRLGKIRKPPTLEPIAETEALYALPTTWAWVRVGDIFDYDAGTKRDPKDLEQSRWLLELEDIEKDTSRIVERLRVSDRNSQSTKSEFEPGDILYGKLRPYLNKVVVADERGYSTTEIVAIRPFLRLYPEYCVLAFRRPDFVAYVERLGRGTKMPRLRTPDAIAALFPLPPLAEQRRIVAKVDELMVLCDALEAARTEREAKRDRLAAASLTRLNTPDPETFHNDARFALDALPALTARPDQFKQLRQTILNLAVRGKLVPQDPADEPAEELLKRVQLRRGRSRKPTVEIEQGNVPYVIPATWTWASLEQLVVFGPQNGISPRPTSREDAPKAITLTATTSGKFNPAYFKHVEGTFPPNSFFWLSDGDLLFQRGNTPEYVGMAAVYKGPSYTFLFPDLIIKVRVSEDIDLSYVHLASISPSGRQYLTENASGAQATMPKINQATLLSLPIPLPPIAEQRRIVAKVDELMALCDQLETSLIGAEETQGKLLDALLAEALAPVDTEMLREAAE